MTLKTLKYKYLIISESGGYGGLYYNFYNICIYIYFPLKVSALLRHIIES